jgi:rare lipoprotein A
VKVRRDTEQAAIHYGTNVVYSDRLLEGQREVERAGVAGLQELTYKVRLEDGVEVSMHLLERRVLREPVNQVLVIGTREPNVQWGIASWYDWDGRSAPCGGTLSGLYAAHRTLPCGTRVTVLNQSNGRTVTVVIRDRGPWIGGRIIDLSDEAFSQIAPLGAGTVRVRIAW